MKTFLVVALFCVLGGTPLSAQESDKLPFKEVPVAPILEESDLKGELLEASITRGVNYLLETQNKNGSWGSATRTKNLNIYAPAPSAHHAYQTATSSLALAGLIASNDNRPEVLAVIAKGEEWLLEELPKLRRGVVETLYNNWGHSYGLRALCALAQRDGVSEEKKTEYKEIAEMQLVHLKKTQDLDGGWGYLALDSVTARPSDGSMSCMTATVLLAVKEAKEVLGVSMEPRLVQQGVACLQRHRTPDFAYSYSTELEMNPRYRINRPAGSLARSPAGHAATRLWGDEKITDEVIEKSLDRLVKRNGWLDIGRKRPDPHETHFGISGYFYYYGHYYATEAMTLLPLENQSAWKSKLAKIIIDKQDTDGSWWDYPLYNYHQAYGTGYALTTLVRCRLSK